MTDAVSSNTPATAPADAAATQAALEVITLGGGCFWCTEAVFLQVRGVVSVESGSCNGHVRNPSYEAVCSGATGLAEVMQLRLAPDQISLAEILRVFLATHDPTTLNRQGHDVGTQYRSGIHWHEPAQADVARAVLAEAAGAFAAPIVTELVALSNYSAAEAYHQRYFELHPGQGDCAHVIAPKVAKFRHAFARHQRSH
ncbi:MAG: peptide-methionine (S)-S-oxide reductase MsrA [Leptothrix sp. (in: b-proteobacteria)]